MTNSSNSAGNGATYREKLLPGLWAFVTPIIIFPSVYLVFLPINQIVGIVLGALLLGSIWLIQVVTAPVIEVRSGKLRVANAQMPLAQMGIAAEVPPEKRFEERGPKLSALAFVRFQVGVKPLVKIENIDEEDPTPYWLFSCRRPEPLIEAIRNSGSA